MIFEQESVSFQIQDILYLEQGRCKSHNAKRSYAALSFRLKADTAIAYGNKRLEFTDHHIAFFPPNTEYVRITRQDVLIAVHIKNVDYQTAEIEQFLPENPGKYERLFRELLACWNQKGIAYKHESAAILNRIFAELYKDNHKNDYADSKIEASIRYIQGNCLKKDFSLVIAAEKSFVSETYFRKLFKEIFGVAPKKYVIRKRIHHAAFLIGAGYYTLGEIAELCGYRDYKHFLTEFKKEMGVSPTQYKHSDTKA